VYVNKSAFASTRAQAQSRHHLTLQRYNELDAAGALAANKHYQPRMDNLRRSRRRLRTKRNNVVTPPPINSAAGTDSAE
jgi:hypothetical protein